MEGGEDMAVENNPIGTPSQEAPIWHAQGDRRLGPGWYERVTIPPREEDGWTFELALQQASYLTNSKVIPYIKGAQATRQQLLEINQSANR